MKYPKEIYVQVEKDGDSSYLLANDKAEDVNEGSVAVYVLKDVGIKTTEHNVTIKAK